MQYSTTVIRRLPGGGYKVCAWGQPDDHIMDWRGTNYRLRTIPGQPRQGFESSDDAFRFLVKHYPTEVDVRKWAAHAGDGSFLTDSLYSTIVIHNAWKEMAVDEPHNAVPPKERPEYIAPGMQRRARKHLGAD